MTTIIPLTAEQKEAINTITVEAMEVLFDTLRVRFIIEAGKIIALEI